MSIARPRFICLPRTLRRPCLSCGRSYATTTNTDPTSYPLPIAPESPDYIDVPQPPQAFWRNTPIVKGVLPVPKSLFPKGSKKKASKEYLDQTAADPTAEKPVPLPIDADRIQYQRLQSAKRRQNLREGLQALAKREEQYEAQDRRAAKVKTKEREERLNAAESEHTRLTNPTILSTTMIAARSNSQLSRTEQRLERKKLNWEKHNAKEVLNRRDAIHTLYMNARHFIVTEKDLEDKIVAEFDKPFNKANPDLGIWDQLGLPDSVQSLLARDLIRNSSELAMTDNSLDITKARIARLSAELTGGKMDDGASANKRP